MEFVLPVVIAFQFAYIIFKDIKESKEREKLQLKLMSKDVQEYKNVTETTNETPKKFEPPKFIDIEDVSPETILKAKV